MLKCSKIQVRSGTRSAVALAASRSVVVGSVFAADVPHLTVDQILDRYVQAAGGEEAVNNTTGRVRMGKVTTDLTGWSAPELVIHGLVGEPSLTADGQLNCFVHMLSDNSGNYDVDVWCSRRAVP